MKAIYLKEHGGPDVLTFGELPEPRPQRDQVQIRLRFAALNRLDLWVRKGWPGLKLDYPHIPGADGAGEISAIGPGVTDIQIGERVVINSNLGCGHCSFCLAGKDNLCANWRLLGETISGTYAEFVVVPARNVLPLPEGFPYEEAAAASLVFHTAWHSLMQRANLKAGETVLVVGASGGVNTASIQIAKLAGAHVIVVGSSAEKLALAESLGADVLINRSKEENWSKAVYNQTARAGVDVVVDNVGAGSMPHSMRAARKGGRILTVGNSAGPVFEIDNRYVFGKHLSILGSSMGTLQDFSEVMRLLFMGKLRAVIGRQFPLHEAAQAQEHLASGDQMGKVILEIH